MPFQPGQLAGDYEVLDVLGKGGMGRVYRVRNVISDRIEAMKVLLDDVGIDSGLEDRFIAEIRTLARLDHPNIAKLHTAFKAQKQLLMVMEFVEGVDLGERAKEGSIPVYKTIGYIQEVLAALGYAHRRGVVHRDIKPSNIMVTQQGNVKLMDFGIAKSNAEPLLTRPGTTLGSMLYMSPEQVRGTGVDARSDLYSVGVVLYELTAGRCPFEAESTYEILNAQLNAPPTPPIEINPSLPKALNEIILTALEKDPAKRFQNADAFRKVLESLTAADETARTRVISQSEIHVPAAFAAAAAATANAAIPPHVQPVPGPAATPNLSPAAASAPAPPQGIAAASLPPQTSKPQGRRGLWMAAAAIACLCIVGAALVALPHLHNTSAASTVTGSGVSGASPQASAPGTQSSPSDALTRGAGSQLDSKDLQTALQQVPNAPSTAPTRPVAQPASPHTHSRTEAGQQQQSQLPRAATTAAPQPPPAAASTAPPAPAPPAGPSQEDLDKANEALINMHARMDAVGQSLARMKQEQAAIGVGMRGDIVSSESRMLSYFQMAERSLQNHDLDATQKNIDRTETELTKLEHFLGR